MKQSKLKGFIYDLEHKNKNFSFNKTLKILDISNAVYLDLISKTNLESLSTYEKSKYMFKEIVNELNFIYKLLDDGNVLMGTCLLRNTYEEILYIMATSLEIELDINNKTKAGYFKEKVCENITDLVSNDFVEEDIC